MASNRKQSFVPKGGWFKPQTNAPQQSGNRTDCPQVKMTAHQKNVISNLQELFSKVFDKDVIQDVAESYDFNLPTSMEALLMMGSSNSHCPKPGPKQHGKSSQKQNSLSFGVAPPLKTEKNLKPKPKVNTYPGGRQQGPIRVAYPGESDDDADVVIEEEFEIIDYMPPAPPQNWAQKARGAIMEIVAPSEPSQVTKVRSKPREYVKLSTLDRIKERLTRGSKVLVLMRGVPGSGKTHAAHDLILTTVGGNPKHHIFSADDFFLKSGTYQFRPDQLPRAHAQNKRCVDIALRQGITPVVVDNTHIQAWEMQPFAALAVTYGYFLELLEPSTPWRLNEAQLAKRNIHGVPRQKIRDMLDRFDHSWTSGLKLLQHFGLEYAEGNKPTQQVNNPPPRQTVVAKPKKKRGQRKKKPQQKDTPGKKGAVADTLALFLAKKLLDEGVGLDQDMANTRLNNGLTVGEVLQTEEAGSSSDDDTSGSDWDGHCIGNEADNLANNLNKKLVDKSNLCFNSNICETDVSNMSKITDVDSNMEAPSEQCWKFVLVPSSSATKYRDEDDLCRNVFREHVSDSTKQCWEYVLVTKDAGYIYQKSHDEYEKLGSSDVVTNSALHIPNDPVIPEVEHDVSNLVESAIRLECQMNTECAVGNLIDLSSTDNEKCYIYVKKEEELTSYDVESDLRTLNEVTDHVQDFRGSMPFMLNEMDKLNVIENDILEKAANPIEEENPAPVSTRENENQLDCEKLALTSLEWKSGDNPTLTGSTNLKHVVVDLATNDGIENVLVQHCTSVTSPVHENTASNDVVQSKAQLLFVKTELAPKYDLCSWLFNKSLTKANDQEPELQEMQPVEVTLQSSELDIKSEDHSILKDWDLGTPWDEEAKLERSQQTAEKDIQPKPIREINQECSKVESVGLTPSHTNQETKEKPAWEVCNSVETAEVQRESQGGDGATSFQGPHIVGRRTVLESAVTLLPTEDNDLLGLGMWSTTSSICTANSILPSAPLVTDKPFPLKVILENEEPRIVTQTTDSETNTSYSDFNLLSQLNKNSHLPGDHRIVLAQNRNIMENISNPVCSTKLATILKFDKSSMASEDDDTSISSSEVDDRCAKDLENLINIFTRLSVDTLKDIFEKCNKDFQWTVEFLLESEMDEYMSYMSTSANIPTESKLSNVKEECDIDYLLQDKATVFDNTDGSNHPSMSQNRTLFRRSGRKDRKDLPEEVQELKKQLENTFVISDAHYSEHMLRIKKLRLGELTPQKLPFVDCPSDTQVGRPCPQIYHEEPNIQDCEEPNIQDHEESNIQEVEEGSSEEEEFLSLALDTGFVTELQDRFANKLLGHFEDLPHLVNLPVSLARQIYCYLVETQQRQLEVEQSYLDQIMKEDEELASFLQEEEQKERQQEKVPNLREIMDMEMALALYKADQGISETKDDMATKLSRRMLHEAFPDANHGVLEEIFEASGCSFEQTVAVLQAEDAETAVRTVMSPEALAAHKNALILEAKLENAKVEEKQPLVTVSNPEEASICSREQALEDTNHYRNEASRHHALRQQCYINAQQAYHKGQAGVARYYSHMAALHKQRIDEANGKAASSLLLAHSHTHQSTTLELHYFLVVEALQVLDMFLDHHVARLESSGQRQDSLYLITGWGRHSPGKARIKPAVVNRLTERNIRYEIENPGLLRVFITKNTPLSCIN